MGDARLQRKLKKIQTFAIQKYRDLYRNNPTTTTLKKNKKLKKYYFNKLQLNKITFTVGPRKLWNVKTMLRLK